MVVRDGIRSVGEAGLAPRELQVLALIAEGRSNDSIATELCLSPKSIESIVRSVFVKLDLLENPAENRRVLAARAFLDSPPAGASEWPRWPSTYVGRVADRASLREAISSACVVTVVGPGGIGKTRLVVETLNEPDEGGRRQRFVDLVGSSGPGVAGRLFEGFGVHAGSVEVAWRKVERQLAGHRSVVILDNAEEQLDAVREVVSRLVAIAGVRVVVTTREPLGLPGERIHRVGSLIDDEALALLIDRLHLAPDSGPALLGGALGQLMAAVDGMPLAIELVAVRLSSTSPDWIAGRVESLLADLARPGADRHASLNAVIDASYERLSDPAQTLFRALSVFVDGFTIESVDRCLAEHLNQIDEALAELMRASLVAASGGRWRMLEPVRQHAARLRGAAGEDALRAGHLIAWCRRLTNSAMGGYATSPERWLARLDPEEANIGAAIVTALETGDTASAFRICGNLAHYWTTKLPGRTLPVIEEAALRASMNEPDLDRAVGLAGLGWLRWFHYEDERARAPLTEACALFEQLGDREQLTICRYWLALIGSDPDEFLTVIDMAREAGNTFIETMAWTMRAQAMLIDAQCTATWPEDRVRAHIVEALDAADRVGSGFPTSNFETLALRSTIMLIDGADENDRELNLLLDEGERLACFVGPTHLEQMWIRRLTSRRRRLPDAADRRMLLMLLDNVSHEETRWAVAESVALAANALRWWGHDAAAALLIDQVAPYFASMKVTSLYLAIHFDDLLERAQGVEPRRLTIDELRSLSTQAYRLVAAITLGSDSSGTRQPPTTSFPS